MSRPELLLDSPREVLAWVQARLDQPLDLAGYQAVGVTRRGRLVAGVVFHDMLPNRADVHLSIAAEGAWCTPALIDFLTWNAFVNLACAHVTCRTAEDNRRAITMLQRAGFVLEGRQRRAWDRQRDALLLGLTNMEDR